MNIVIVVHSKTGNTWDVSCKLQSKLEMDGHKVSLYRIEGINEESPKEDIVLKSSPSIEPYEGLILACPVHGFLPSKVMKTYLSKLPLLKGKKIICFVTESFPYPWMGGNKAIKEMTTLCKAKGEGVVGTFIINWGRKNREKQVIDEIERVSKLFT